MGEYVKREAALRMFDRYFHSAVKEDTKTLVLDMKQAFLELPYAEAEPVRHGRWERYADDKFMGYGADGKIKYRKVYTYECDRCRHGTAVKTSCCPKCGARMKGGGI